MRASDSFLVLSLLMLGVGPIFSELARHGRAFLAALDGFVLVTVVSLVLLHVLPHSMEEGGFLAVLVAFLGLVGPYSIERVGARGARASHLILRIVIIFGLIPHAALDGMALIASAGHDGGGQGAALPLAVVFHRIPVGFAVWWLVRPVAGMRWAFGTLALMAVATGGGYFFGASYLTGLHGQAVALFTALIGGSLLHVLLHGFHADSADAERRHWQTAECLGALAGLAVIGLLPGTPEQGPGRWFVSETYVRAFLALALESAPALLLGYLMAGVLGVFLPHASLNWLRRGGSFSQAWRGMVYGLPLPICSCGVVPVYRSLIARNAPVTAAMAFLIATPELGVESLLLSLPLLGGSLTAARLACALTAAILVGWFVGRTVTVTASATEPTNAAGQTPHATLTARIRQALRTGLGEVVDETAPWILVGVAVAAALAPVSMDWLTAFPAHLDVVLFAFVGLPMYVCASGATPLAAVLILKGVSPGAAIAFLLTGPATNLTTFGVLARLHGRANAARFAVGVIVVSVLLGYAVNGIIGSAGVPPPVGETEGHAGPIQWVCLAVLSVAFLLSVLRMGPRSFAESLVRIHEPGGDACGDGGHDHAHGRACGCGGGAAEASGSTGPVSGGRRPNHTAESHP